MAYIYSEPLKDEEVNPVIADAVTSSSGNLGAGLQTPSKSGSFVNLQRYLDTNQQQSQDLAGRVGSQIGEKVTGAETAIKNYGDSGDAAIRSGTASYNPDLVNRAISSPEGFSDTDKTQLKNLRTGVYGGPQNITGLGTPDEIGKVQEYGELGKTSGGRQELLRQLPGATQYAKGGISLDQLLLQNSDPARQTLEKSIASTEPIKGKFTSAQDKLNQQIQDAREASTQTGQQITGELNSALGSQQKTITDRLQQRRIQQQQEGEGIETALTKGNLQGEVLQKLSMTPEQWSNLQLLQQQAKGYGESGVNLADYYSARSPNALTAENVATAEEKSKYNALAGLAGVNPNFLTGQLDATGNPYAFNTAGANEALNAQVAAGKGRFDSNTANATIIAQQKQAAEDQKQAFAKADDAQKQQIALTLASAAMDVMGIGKDAALKAAWNYLSGQTAVPVTELSFGAGSTALGTTTGAAELGAGTGGAFDTWAAGQAGVEAGTASGTTAGAAGAEGAAASTTAGGTAAGEGATAGSTAGYAGAGAMGAFVAALYGNMLNSDAQDEREYSRKREESRRIANEVGNKWQKIDYNKYYAPNDQYYSQLAQTGNELAGLVDHDYLRSVLGNYSNSELANYIGWGSYGDPSGNQEYLINLLTQIRDDPRYATAMNQYQQSTIPEGMVWSNDEGWHVPFRVGPG